MKRRVHKLEVESGYGSEPDYAWIACRDPERFQEPDGRKYKSARDWSSVTCRACLRKRGQ